MLSAMLAFSWLNLVIYGKLQSSIEQIYTLGTKMAQYSVPSLPTILIVQNLAKCGKLTLKYLSGRTAGCAAALHENISRTSTESVE